MWKARVFTLYPELFPGPLGSGLYKKALDNKLWSLEVINIRDYAPDKHKTVDDTPFGGGSGMVMRADVIANSLDKNIFDTKEKIIYLSPKGKIFDQSYAKKIMNKNVNIICGHFEGVDQRVLDHRKIEEISIGDFILSGGESAAIIILDAVLRLIPGVLGNENSVKDESFTDNLLEYPQYTHPRVWNNLSVPEVLLSGNHKEIRKWRNEKALYLTKKIMKKNKKNDS